MKIDRKYDPLLIAVLALLIRLIYVVQLSKTVFFAHPIVDAEYHDAWAREILQQGIGHEGVFFRAPLYPYFLAAIYALTNGSFMAARLAQALLGSLTAVLTYALGWEITRRRSVALLAGCAAALYGILVYLDGELLVETLFIPLLLAACWLYARARAQKKPWPILGAGVLLGLAAITRPSALVILPILGFDLLLASAPGKQRMRMGKRLFAAFALATGCFLPILPVTYHNARQAGDFVLIASPAGINFYIGNNPEADGMHSWLPGLGSTWDVPGASYFAYQSQGQSLNSSQVSSFYSGLAWKFILEQPRQAARLMLKKFCVFWNRIEISNNRDLYFFLHETPIMPDLRLLGFWIIGPLGLWGWWIGWRRKILPGWFLWIIPVYMVSVVAFFVTARFRAPMIPFLLICGGVGVAHLLERRRLFWDQNRTIEAVALLLAAAFVNTNPWKLQEANRAHSFFCLGGAYMKAGDLTTSRRAYQSALEADSLYPRAHLNLGVLAYLQKDSTQAVAEYQKELLYHPRDARALNNLGVLSFEQGHFAQAGEFYRRALQLEPYYNDARINLAQSLFKQGMEEAAAGELQEAVRFFSETIELDGEKALYHYNYALAMGKLGYADPAKEHLQRALALAPDFQVARDLLRQLQQMPSGGTQAPP